MSIHVIHWHGAFMFCLGGCGGGTEGSGARGCPARHCAHLGVAWCGVQSVRWKARLSCDKIVTKPKHSPRHSEAPAIDDMHVSSSSYDRGPCNRPDLKTATSKGETDCIPRIFFGERVQTRGWARKPLEGSNREHILWRRKPLETPLKPSRYSGENLA